MSEHSHIVDILIAERAPRLRASPLWPVARPLLYRMLDYGKARALADAVAPMGGHQAMDYVSGLLRVRTAAAGLERIPPAGRLMVVCNHPTGLADGVAVYDALKPIRPDLMILANSDAMRVSPRLDEILIPVEWMEAKRTRARTRLTLTMARQAFEAERCVVVFPAGRLATRQGGVLVDPPWQATAVSLARKYAAPVAPIHLAGPPSTLFLALDKISRELRDITLFHEMLNKGGREFRLTVGPLIDLAACDGEDAAVSARLQAYVQRDLAADPDRTFP